MVFSAVPLNILLLVVGGMIGNIVMEVKPVQSWKHFSPKRVTEEGMVREVKPVQPLKHEEYKSVTDSGMAMEVKPVQPSKHEYSKRVTEEGIRLLLHPAINPLVVFGV